MSYLDTLECESTCRPQYRFGGKSVFFHELRILLKFLKKRIKQIQGFRFDGFRMLTDGTAQNHCVS